MPTYSRYNVAEARHLASISIKIAMSLYLDIPPIQRVNFDTLVHY